MENLVLFKDRDYATELNTPINLEYSFQGDIAHFKNVLSKQDCEFIINTVEKYCVWNSAATYGGVTDYRKTKMVPLSKIFGYCADLFKAHSLLGYAFKSSFEQFQKLYVYDVGKTTTKTHVSFTNDEGFQMLKYEPGDVYYEHIDFYGAAHPNERRIYSTIIYLNNNYVGGETFFPRQDILVKGNTGDVLFFPSAYTHPHIAKEVVSGEKYAVVLWSC